MKIFARLFGLRRDASLATVIERQRLARTMPGQTAAMAANRLGVLVLKSVPASPAGHPLRPARQPRACRG